MIISATVPVRQAFAFLIVLVLLLAAAMPIQAQPSSSDSVAISSQVNVAQTTSSNTTPINTRAAASADQRPEPVVNGSSIVQVVLSLIFIIVLIYAVAWYLRKMQFSAAMPGQRMQVVSALSVGARERVVLVQVGEEQVLLGVAPGRVNLLHRYPDPIISAAENDGNHFAKVLGSKLRGGVESIGGENSRDQQGPTS